MDASSSSSHDTSTTISDNEVGTTDVSDDVAGNGLGPDGLGDVPG